MNQAANMKKKLRFITNPFSGGKSKIGLKKILDETLDLSVYEYELCYTDYPGHAQKLSEEAVSQKYFGVIAVGGDGTINEVGAGLVESGVALGLIPFGSGNGFSYHLGIRRDIIKAITAINQCQTDYIDSGSVNGRFFINVSGLGLDAKVAFKTKLNKKRGFLPYFINTIKESFNFKFLKLEINCNGKSWIEDYAMAVIANGSVYGYDFTIAPLAILHDGKFDVILVKKAPIYKYIFLIPRMLNKTFHKSNLVEFFTTDKINIKNFEPGYLHVDGEGFESNDILSFIIKPKSILLFKANN